MTGIIGWSIGFALTLAAYAIVERLQRRSVEADLRSLKADVLELQTVRDQLVARVMAMESQLASRGMKLDVSVVSGVKSSDSREDVDSWNMITKAVAAKRREAFEKERAMEQQLRDELLEGRPL